MKYLRYFLVFLCLMCPGVSPAAEGPIDCNHCKQYVTISLQYSKEYECAGGCLLMPEQYRAICDSYCPAYVGGTRTLDDTVRIMCQEMKLCPK